MLLLSFSDTQINCASYAEDESCWKQKESKSRNAIINLKKSKSREHNCGSNHHITTRANTTHRPRTNTVQGLLLLQKCC